ncbi:hypothetical protein TRFO_18085 [Tritrichomonas foetus]|uniref:Uncharacterized protein n=1 Tax=Tritrichomonas foetus TaxID=1144522 RepID=A0A1J4KR88_9EUKA|nr:hypothetical protein TRFO_18085 [Tritrichomonas foetus]|eukprot:OHT12190.1 hypothetical protein TRFO_18085 [Tritrichomonas foetus]
MKINVIWNYGSIRLDILYQDKMQDVLKNIGNQINIDPRFLSLYFDCKFDRMVKDRGSVLNAKIQDKSTLYLKITNSKRIEKPENLKICSMTERTDTYKDYLGPNEKELTPEMKRVQQDFSKFTISTAFFEHKNRLLPHIDFQDESSCYAFRIGEECMKRFQSIAFQTNFSTHRIGFLFGRINETTGKVTAHVLMEPPQENNYDRVIITDNTSLDCALEIAKDFGMKCVGMAISHQTDSKYPMTSYMIEKAAYYQNLFGEYFTTLVVMPRGEEDVIIEAFQVSDAAMRCSKEKLFAETDSDKIIKFNEPIFTCNIKQNEADVNLFLCAVRVRLTESKFLNHTFPSLSQIPSPLDLKMYFVDKEFSPTWYQMFDFNLLTYLLISRVLSKGEIDDIIARIVAKQDIQEEVMAKIHRTYSNLS